MKYRFERKFVVREDFDTVVDRVRLSPAMFRKAFPPRDINNIYFDTPDRRHFWENVAGLADRVKVRIRWYGPMLGTAAKPTLEIKIKRGLIGTKKSYRLPQLTIENPLRSAAVREWLSLADLPETEQARMLSHQPVLLNRYRRHYFVTPDNQLRLTVDSNLRFYKIDGGINHLFTAMDPVQHDLTVVELKYPSDFGRREADVAAALPYRVTRMSKYVFGLECLAS